MSRSAKTGNRCLVGMAVIFLVLVPLRTWAGTGWGVPTSAPLAYETQKLSATDGANADFFGMSISISGDWMIVGAYRDDDRGTDSGSAYIFARNGTGWVQWQKLTAADGAAGDNFGWAVSISGDWAMVGTPGDDSTRGSVYVFKWNGTSWGQQYRLYPHTSATGNQFGYSVSLEGERAIIGAYAGDGSITDCGSAYIFIWNGLGWPEQQTLLASDGAVGDQFGHSVSINGDYVVVGAPNDDDNGGETGAAYVFKWSGASWLQQRKLTASDGGFGDYFGHTVSISGAYVIVGGYGNDESRGAAYVFVRSGTNWSQQAKLTALDRAADDIFGLSVCISGDYAIVGAYNDDDKGASSGSAYVFERRGTTWKEAKLLASDGEAGDLVGVCVAISDDYAVVGALLGDGYVTDSGAVYAFGFCPREDLNDDCKVDFIDYAMFADSWLYGTE